MRAIHDATTADNRLVIPDSFPLPALCQSCRGHNDFRVKRVLHLEGEDITSSSADSPYFYAIFANDCEGFIHSMAPPQTRFCHVCGDEYLCAVYTNNETGNASN